MKSSNLKLFIDTSNKKIILALVDGEFIVDFFMEDTHNDIVKNSVFLINKFLLKNKTNLNSIKNFMVVTGPGSFTGAKVALNIIRTANLINKVETIETISSFNLISNKDYKKTAIKFGKTKYYLKEKWRTIIVTEEELKEIDNVNIGYDIFTKEVLEEKIMNKEFKLLDNLNKVKIKYLSDF